MREENVAFPVMLKAAGAAAGAAWSRSSTTRTCTWRSGRRARRPGSSSAARRCSPRSTSRRAGTSRSRSSRDAHGNVVHLYERECTIQRRHQKIVEEAPSPTLDAELRDEICATAARLMREIGYASAAPWSSSSTPRRGASTPGGQHAAAGRARHHRADHGSRHRRADAGRRRGQAAAFSQKQIRPNRWALEVRLNAEDPRSFNPSFGTISRLVVPQGPNVRIASGSTRGRTCRPTTTRC